VRKTAEPLQENVPVNKDLQTLGTHTLIYGLGIIVSKAASFIMLPIYTRCLTPADYGTLELLSTTIDVISMIAGVGLAGSVFKFYYEYDMPRERGRIISTATLTMLVISTLVTALGLTYSKKITTLVFGTPDNVTYFRMFFLIYLLQSGNLIPYLYLRARQESVRFVAVSIAKLILQLTLNICFVVWLRWGVTGVLSSTLVAESALLLYLSVYTFQRVGFEFSVHEAKRLIAFGYPLVFWSLGSFLITFSDRYFLNHFSDTASVGIYSLACKFGFILTTLAFVPFNQIWEPQRFEIAKRPQANETFRRVFFDLNLILLSMALIISLFSRDVVVVMADPAFHEAYKLVPIIMLTMVFQSWTAYCNIGFFLQDKMRMYALSAAIAVAVSLTLNALLIPRFGYYGAAWAGVGVFGVRFLVVYAMSQRYYPIEYGWQRLARLAGAIALVYALRQLAGWGGVLISASLSLALTVGFLYLLYSLFLGDDEKLFLRRLVAKPLAAISFSKTGD